MLPILLDAGLPPAVALAFRALGLDAQAVGDDDAPAQDSDDDTNCRWCAERSAILVTNDRGKKDRQILDALAQHHVHAIFVYRDLRAAPPHELARALLVSEGKMHSLTAGRKLIRHRLRAKGGLDPR